MGRLNVTGETWNIFSRVFELASMSNRLKCSNIPCIQFDEQYAFSIEMHFQVTYKSVL